MTKRELLVTDVRAGDALDMEIQHQDGTMEQMRILLVHKSGRIARLCIDAPESVHFPGCIREKENTAG